MAPSNFMVKPMGSVFQKSEHETVAANIMVILGRTGDTFRELSWKEYKEERIKDGNFSYGEKGFFEDVVPYTKSEDTARLFSPIWREVK